MTNRDSRRTFTQTQKNEILVQQDYKCAKCHTRLDVRIAEYHHIKGWAAQGRTVIRNGAALCPNCHKLTTHKERLKSIEIKSSGTQPVSSQTLEKLSTKQLKFLAQKHHIRIKGSTRWSLWDGDYTNPPTKRQFITKLKGLVTVNDINTLPKEDT